jgi:nucleoside 2-deoxyribosyltransferase
MKRNHKLYLAGPLCFYPDGNTMWDSNRKEAEFYGFTVTMPNDNKLVKDGEKISKEELANRIFKNCAWGIDGVDGILVNLETYRGSEPDGGSIYELGMAYGVGARCYGFTRDKRTIGVKYQAARYNKDAKTATDINGDYLAHHNLPFSVNLVSSMKIIEGDFTDCLKAYMTDLDEESKLKANPNIEIIKKEPFTAKIKSDKPLVYVSMSDRDNKNAAEKYEKMRKTLEKYGFEGVFPTDDAPGIENIVTDDKYQNAYNLFSRYTAHVRNCDIILLDLNDYRGGFEPNSDVAFEGGYSFELGKKQYGFMNNIGPMVNRIPNTRTEDSTRDFNGMNVEDFNAPLNLMFGSSVKLFDGDFEEIVKKIADDFNK